MGIAKPIRAEADYDSALAEQLVMADNENRASVFADPTLCHLRARQSI